METLQSIMANANMPVLSAIILGIMTAISPCPLATNITAISFIFKDIQSKKRILLNGIFFTLGKVVSYTILAWILLLILKEGASVFKIQKFITKYGEMILPWFLIAGGIFLIVQKYLNIKGFSFSINKGRVNKNSFLSVFILGIVFSMAFCPTSAVFFFGILVPMSAVSASGFALPVIFALFTALPVIIVAFIIAFSVNKIGSFYNKTAKIQNVMSIAVGVIFIAAGIFYLLF